MVKILHIGDVHLDHPLGKYKESVRKVLFDAQHKTFIRAIDKAIELDIDAFLIAGDLFHGKTLTYKTEKMLKGAFEKLAGAEIQCVYLTGNHDPGLEMNVFLRKHMEFVTLMDTSKVQTFEFKSKDQTPYCLVGCGHEVRGESRPLIDGYPKKDKMVTIGIAHTMVGHVSDDESEPYMPSTLEMLESKNYDYFALGHIHKGMMLTDTIAYSGCLQGISAKETGEKGGYYVTVDDYGSHVEFIPLNVIQMETLELDIEAIESMMDLEDAIISGLPEYGHPRIKTLMRIELKGESMLYPLLKKEAIEVIEEAVENEGYLYASIKTNGVTQKMTIPDDIFNEGMIKTLLSIMEDKALLLDYLMGIEPFKSEYRSKDALDEALKDVWKACENQVLELMVKDA